MRNKQSQQKRIFWQHHIAAAEESGLTISAYCRRESLSIDQFWYWKKVLRLRNNESNRISSFLPVEVVERKLDLDPHNCGGVLPDPKWLAEFILALGRCGVSQ